MGIEQRRYKRVILKREVLINGSIGAQGLDLSVGGMYVHTGRTFAVGDHVSVTLPLNEKQISIRGRIQNTQESLGMGIMFVDMTDEQKTEIEMFVESVAQAIAGSGKKTVMLVDDDATSRRIYRSKLMLDGFSVLEAQDGIQALGQLEKEKIDIVVLDLYMAEMDGYKVLSIVRQKPEWKEMPVLVLSARSAADDVDKAVAAGATEFLVKMMTSPVKLSQRLKSYFSATR